MKAIIASVALTFACAPALAQQTPAAPAPTNADCIGGTAKFLELGVKVFDQDQDKGWRAVAHKPGCELAAAQLIATYRKYVLERIETLYWHEGQIYANSGDYPKAIEAMNKSLEVRRDYVDWSDRTDAADIVYSLATIAFLKGDRAGLERQRAELAVIPAPEDWAGVQAAFRQQVPNMTPPTWPQNLEIVDALVACFGKPYSEAYGGAECRGKGAQVKPN
jgi:hypothetical protein